MHTISSGSFLIEFSLQEYRADIRAMNLDMTDGAILEPRISDIVKRWRLRAENAGRVGVAFQAELAHQTSLQQLGVVRAVRRVTDDAAFQLDRRVLECKRPLFLRVALEADRICPAGRVARLSEIKAAMGIVTIGAAHASFRDAMMKRSLELLRHIAVTLVTQRRNLRHQQKL